jgi:hypothetical protein
MEKTKTRKRKWSVAEHHLCADIRTGSFTYFIASHGSPRTTEWIEDEAIASWLELLGRLGLTLVYPLVGTSFSNRSRSSG